MRYIGNKTNILPWLKECIISTVGQEVTNINKFYDLFAGTGSVSEHFKTEFNVVGNDMLESSCVVTKGRLLNKIPENIDRYIELLNKQSTVGFITEKFSEGSRLYFSKQNGMKIDGIMQTLIRLKQTNVIDNDSYYYLLYCVINSIHSVSNTTGVYGAYLKKLNQNAIKEMKIKKLDLVYSENTHECHNLDCIDLLDSIEENDIIYADPPYNSRQYGTNYHLLETIVKYDNPQIKQVRGNESVTGLREDTENSKWCIKKTVRQELQRILDSKAKYIFMSYNNEGILTELEITELLEQYGTVTVFKKLHKKYKSNKNNNEKEIYELLFALKK
jgi:adenine-specific DNA-methyltransferase